MKKLFLILFTLISAFTFGQGTHNQFYRPVNAVVAGCDSTGATNVVPIIQGLVNAGYRNIYLPKGTYLWTTQMNIKDSVHIWGDGMSQTLINQKANVTAIKFNSVGTSAEIDHLGFYGTFSGFNGGGGNANQVCIDMDSVGLTSVHDCGGFWVAGFFVRILGNGYLPFATFQYGDHVERNVVISGGTGIMLDTKAEFNTIQGNTITGPSRAIDDKGGNNLIVSNNCSGSAYGLYLETGPNDGHGMAENNFLTHCTTDGLFATGVVNGYQLNNNDYNSSNIALVNDSDIAIIGGDAGTNIAITVTNCTRTVFQNVRWLLGPPTWTITGTAPTVTSDFYTNFSFSVFDVDSLANADFGAHNGQGQFNGSAKLLNYKMFKPFQSMNGLADNTRDMCLGPTRFDGPSGGIVDAFQFYRPGTTGHTMSVFDNPGNPLFLIYPTGKIGVGNVAGTVGNITIPTAVMQLAAPLSTAAGTSPLKFTAENVATTAASGTGTTATITVATSTLPWYIGQTITVAGMLPSGYNGTFTITAFGSSTVSYANATTGAQTQAGTVQSVLLATPEQGAIESDAKHIYFTDNTATRFQLDQQTLDQTLAASGVLSTNRTITLSSNNLILNGSGVFEQQNTAGTTTYGSVVGPATGATHYGFGHIAAGSFDAGFLDFDATMNITVPANFSLGSSGTLTLPIGSIVKVTTGAGGRAGQIALVSGTKAITITGVTSSSLAFVTLVTPTGTSLTTTYQAVCTTNTLTLQANIAAGTINTF